LAANYFKERGVDNFNEELNLLNYAAKLSEISKSFLEKVTILFTYLILTAPIIKIK